MSEQSISLLAGSPSSVLDVAALAWFLIASAGYQWVSGLGVLERRSLTGAVQRQRVLWIRNMAMRENRMLDGMVMTQLGQGNAFFASTSAIAIGGLAALLGSGQKLAEVLERLPFAQSGGPGLVEIKTLLLMAVFVYAFFKFAWAFRLSHYCGIMIGATPLFDGSEDDARERQVQALAGLIGIAANHANSGVRAFYYAIAALAWYFHPALFMLATTWVLLILIRRDFLSRSRRVLAMGA